MENGRGQIQLTHLDAFSLVWVQLLLYAAGHLGAIR